MTWILAIGLKNALLALPLAALALAAGRWLKRPALTHLLWAVVLVKLLTPPLIDVPVGWKIDVQSWLVPGGEKSSPSVARSTTSPAATAQTASPSSHVSGRRTRSMQTVSSIAPRATENAPAARPKSSLLGSVSAMATPARLLSGAVVCWIAGSILMASMYGRRAWRFRRFIRLASRVDHELPARAAELAAQVGVGVPPRLIVVDGIVSPMLWGVGRSARIVFPAQLAHRLGAAELDSLLLHELAHYSRGDHYVRVLELAAHILFWWNPLVWLARREIEAAEEECCDAWVIQRQHGSRHSYAEALLTTIDFLYERPALAPPGACGLGAVPLLKLRLTQIMRGEPAAPLSPAVRAIVLSIGVIVSPLEPALWASATPSPRGTSRVADVGSDQGLRPSPSASGRSISPSNAQPASTSALISSASSPRTPSALPLAMRPATVHWATAVSPAGQIVLEARVGHRTTLLNRGSGFRLDLSAHQMTCVSFAPDGVVFASGHHDAVVRLWDSQTGGLVRPLKGADAAITTVHVSPDGRRVAAGASAGQIIVWELATGEEVAGLGPLGSPIDCLRWSPSGDRIAVTVGGWSEGDPSMLLVWSPKENSVQVQQPLGQPGGAIDWLGEDALVVAAWNGRAQVWNLATGVPGPELQLEKDQVSAAAWSPNCPLVTGWLAGQLSARTEQ